MLCRMKLPAWVATVSMVAKATILFLQAVNCHGDEDVKLSPASRALPASNSGALRVMTVHGSKDETVSCEEAKSFDRLLSNHTLRILDGADHYFRKHRQALNLIVGEFVKASIEISPLERRAKEDSFRTKVSSLSCL
ncbi:hypothetical protein L7F22_007245 [Adiantum nelumboides]|nr:hypothetical protein [Adiantum nelumboides]